MILPLLLTLAHSPVSEDPPDAAALLDRAHAKIFAPSAPAPPPANLRLVGHAAWVGMPGGGEVTEVYAGLRRAHVAMEFEGFGTFEFGTNGDLCWEETPNGITIRRAWDGTEYLRRFGWSQHAPWREMYASATCTGSSEVEGRAVWVLKLVPKPLLPGIEDGTPSPPPDELFVDRETELPVRLFSQTIGLGGNTSRVRVDFDDWRPAAGALFPHRREVEVSGFTMKVEYASIEADVELAAGTFDLRASVIEAVARQAGAPDEEGSRVEVVSLEARHVASIRVQCSRDELQKTFSVILPEVFQYVTSKGAQMTGPPLVRYHQWSDDTCDVEAALPLASPIEPTSRVAAETLPAGRALVLWHVGPYDRLSETHEALEAYAKEEGLERGPFFWEEYWTDPGTEPDPSRWRTKVVWPLAVGD